MNTHFNKRSRFYRFKTDEEVREHKVRFLLDNHWRRDEIASELHITLSEVNRIIDTVIFVDRLFW